MRLATVEDVPGIAELMEQSIRALFPAYYDAQQVESSVVYVGHLDEQLVHDGTYYVHAVAGEIVACGGWSRRNKVFAGPGDADDDDRLLDPATEPARVRAMFVRGDWTRRGLGRAILEACERAARAEGFKRLVLGATLPGVPLYEAYGFTVVEAITVTMPDGVSVPALSMEMVLPD
jgi:GNAT superfamily N-acetyltransferase